MVKVRVSIYISLVTMSRPPSMSYANKVVMPVCALDSHAFDAIASKSV